MATHDDTQLKTDKAAHEGIDFSAGTAFASPLRDFHQWFGGPGVKIGPRISPVVVTSVADSDNENSAAILDKQRALEANAAIQYRTCSWQKVCLLSFYFLLESASRFPGLLRESCMLNCDM